MIDARARLREILDRLEAVQKAGTPGPWHLDEHYPDTYLWGPNMQMIADHDAGADADIPIRMRGVGQKLPRAANAKKLVAAVNLAPIALEQFRWLVDWKRPSCQNTGQEPLMSYGLDAPEATMTTCLHPVCEFVNTQIAALVDRLEKI